VFDIVSHRADERQISTAIMATRCAFGSHENVIDGLWALRRPLPCAPATPIKNPYLARRAREWLSRSKIADEAPGGQGATKAHTAGM